MKNVDTEYISAKLSERLCGVVRHLDSQNFNSRSKDIREYGKELAVVLHGVKYSTAEEVAQVFEKYCVSVHFIVDKGGSVYTMVPVEKRAWHAGHSQWGNGNSLKELGINCNSIGIGIVGDDEPCTEQQMKSILVLLQTLEEEYKIDKRNIIGHSDIAPGRQFNPNGYYFDWSYLYKYGGFGLYAQKLIDIRDEKSNKYDLIFKHFVDLGISSEKLDKIVSLYGITGTLFTEEASSGSVLAVKTALKSLGYGYLDIESPRFCKALRIDLNSDSEKVKNFQVAFLMKLFKTLDAEEPSLYNTLYSSKMDEDGELVAGIQYYDFNTVKAFCERHYPIECGFNGGVDGLNLQIYYVMSALLEDVCGKEVAAANASAFFNSLELCETESVDKLLPESGLDA